MGRSKSLPVRQFHEDKRICQQSLQQFSRALPSRCWTASRRLSLSLARLLTRLAELSTIQLFSASSAFAPSSTPRFRVHLVELSRTSTRQPTRFSCSTPRAVPRLQQPLRLLRRLSLVH